MEKDMKAVTYLRVSSKEQKQEGYSIPAQKKLLKDFAQTNGFQIVRVFEDDETAKSAGRSNFGEMIEYLKKTKDVNTILVEKTDRLYRNFKDYITIDGLDITIYLVKENEKLGKDSPAHQKFIHEIKLVMAKNFIDNLSEETKKGLLAKAENGEYPGSMPPLGYKISHEDKKSKVVVDDENKDLAIAFFEFYSTGRYSLKSLLNKLKNDGMIIENRFPKSSKLKLITVSTAHRILRNPFYYGDFLWTKILYKGNHTPLISKELWDKVQAKLDKHNAGEAVPKYSVKKFDFKGMLECGECGRSITAEEKIKPSGKRYVYYRCTKFETNCTQKPVNETVLHTELKKSLKGLDIPQYAIDDISKGLKEHLELKRGTEDRAYEKLVDEKLKLENKLSLLYEDRLDKRITEAFYDNKAKELEGRITELDNKISKYTKANIDYYNLGVKILELAKNALKIYESSKAEEKQELLSFLLSNSQLKDEKPLFIYKKPFDRVLARSVYSDWGA